MNPSESSIRLCATVCPLCGGPSREQRGNRRCLRCGFEMCECCESTGETAMEEGEAEAA